MAKNRKRLLVALVCIVVAMASMFCLTACGEKPTYKVTFMAQENATGVYQQYAEATTNEDGSVTLPKKPEAKFYDFRGWFTDVTLTTAFDDKNVTSDMTVYAKFVDQKVDVKIIDETGTTTTIEDQKVVDLESIKAEQTAAAEAKNLVFYSWFKNENVEVPYEPGDDATEIFGRYMAKVVFDNGFKVVKEQLVIPGQKVENPGQTNFDEMYMDTKDISYVEAEDKVTPINFDNPIKANTLIRVIWATPNIKLTPIEDSKYFMAQLDSSQKPLRETYPCISIPGKMEYINPETGAKSVVEVGTVWGAFSTSLKVAKKVIIGEGIRDIKDFNGNSYAGCPIEEIELPSTLKIIENSFCSMNKLDELTIPDGVEIIFDSFWQDWSYMNPKAHGFTNFELVIPASVNNISRIPADVTFAEGSLFHGENGRVYKEEEGKKILVSDIDANMVNEVLTIPDGVDAIQVGAFKDIKYKYVIFPLSFKEVSYNNFRINYDYYYGGRLAIDGLIGPDGIPTDSDGKMTKEAYAVIDNVDRIENVIFPTSEYPSSISPYAIGGSIKQGRNQVYATYEAFPMEVVFTADVELDSPVVVIVEIYNAVTEEKELKRIDDLTSGTRLTSADLMTKLGLSDKLIVSATQFGLDYFNANGEKMVMNNQYIKLSYEDKIKGYTYKIDGKTAVITGFDKETAVNIEEGNPDSPFIVKIPAKIEGKDVVAIADEAFMNNEFIGKVIISNSVKTIGAKAFYGAKNLGVVEIADGGLETIGNEAFKYSGAVKEENALPVVTDSLPKVDEFPSLSITLPLGKLKSIGMEAFNSPAIRKFTAAESEADRLVLPSGRAVDFTGKVIDGTKLTDGEFYFFGGTNTGICKLVDRGTTTHAGKELPLYNIEIVANAPGNVKDTVLGIGASHQSFSGPLDCVRATIKSGALGIYPQAEMKGYSEIVFAAAGKIEANAFYYVAAPFLECALNKEGTGVPGKAFRVVDGRYDCMIQPEQIMEQNAEIFAEGWLMNRANADNTEFLTRLTWAKGADLVNPQK